MLQNFFYVRQFRLLKLSFFVHTCGTTRKVAYVHPRLDSILELCQTFPIEVHIMEKYLPQNTRQTLIYGRMAP